MVLPNVLIKIVSAVFEVFRKKEAKKPLFSFTITILDHTLYGKVKKIVVIWPGPLTRFEPIDDHTSY